MCWGPLCRSSVHGRCLVLHVLTPHLYVPATWDVPTRQFRMVDFVSVGPPSVQAHLPIELFGEGGKRATSSHWEAQQLGLVRTCGQKVVLQAPWSLLTEQNPYFGYKGAGMIWHDPNHNLPVLDIFQHIPHVLICTFLWTTFIVSWYCMAQPRQQRDVIVFAESSPRDLQWSLPRIQPFVSLESAGASSSKAAQQMHHRPFWQQQCYAGDHFDIPSRSGWMMVFWSLRKCLVLV